jgi:hypothetical protein
MPNFEQSQDAPKTPAEAKLLYLQAIQAIAQQEMLAAESKESLVSEHTHPLLAQGILETTDITTDNFIAANTDFTNEVTRQQESNNSHITAIKKDIGSITKTIDQTDYLGAIVDTSWQEMQILSKKEQDLEEEIYMLDTKRTLSRNDVLKMAALKTELAEVQTALVQKQDDWRAAMNDGDIVFKDTEQ